MYKYPSIAKAAAASMTAGTDINCGTAYKSGIPDAIESKLLDEIVLNEAISRTLLGRFEVGQFDPPEDNPYTKITMNVVGSEKHLELARKAAAESAVLLKNTGNALPLRVRGNQKYKKVAVIGPSADDTLVLLGNYHGLPAYQNVSTPLKALEKRLGAENVLYAAGVNVVTGDGAWGFDAAIDACNKANVAVMFIGSSSKGSFNGTNHLDTIEKESMDRRSIDMPGLQMDLVHAILKKTNISIIVVLVDGGPIAIEELVNNERVIAIVNVFYPGQMGGEGVVDVLMGDVSVSGKLPMTMYHKNYTDEIEATNMNMRTYPGRTYKFVQVPVLFPFGFGLSYTKFQYDSLSISKRREMPLHGSNYLAEASFVDVSFIIRNVGEIQSDLTVLLFLSYREAPANEFNEPTKGVLRHPIRQLKYFTKLKGIKPQNDDDVRSVNFELKHSDFELIFENGMRKFVEGKWRVEINHDSILAQEFYV